VAVFAVVIDDGRNRSFIGKMERLTGETGGILYRTAPDRVVDLNDRFSAVLESIRCGYEISYTSALPEDGQGHVLHVWVCPDERCIGPGEAVFTALRAGWGPTPTAVPPTPLPQVALDVIVYADENNNNLWEPDEGIEGVNVRMVDPRKNRTVLSIRTMSNGHASFLAYMPYPMWLVVYYIGGFSVAIDPQNPPAGPIVLRVPPLSLPGVIP